jgi:phosphopantothenoylcysteine decarboxylase/phosphopantothenate--cysteine ligase
MVVAPATAILVENGKWNDKFCQTIRCPSIFAPAMDLDMYIHPSTINTFNALKKFEILLFLLKAENSSGLSGQGRMAEPENIIAFLKLI